MTDEVNAEESLGDELAAQQRTSDFEGACRDAQDLQRAQERLVALSRTAAKVQSVLDPDRVFETMGGELASMGIRCFFGLLDNAQGEVVVAYTNLGQSALRVVERFLGAGMEGLRFRLDSSPYLQAVLDEGRALFDHQPAESMREILSSPLKAVAPQIAGVLQARKAISAPLLSGERTVGILTVWSDDLTEEDVPAVSILAQQAAMAIEHAGLYKEEMRRVFEMEALRKTTLDITKQLDLQQLLRSIVERAASLMATKGGALYLYDQEEEELELAVSHHLGDDYTGIRLELGEGLSGRVALTGEPMIVQDYQRWDGRSEKYAGANLGPVIGVPLKWGNKIIGVVNVTDVEKPRVFTDRDLRLLELFASQAAIAIENARLYEEQERKSQELMALYETSLHIISRLDLDSLLEAIISRAMGLFDGRSGDVYLYRASQGDLISAASLGLPPAVKGGVLKSGEGVAGRVLQTGEPLIVDDYDSWEGRSERYAGCGLGRVMGVPITYGGELLGVLIVERGLESPRFVQADVGLLSLFGNQAAIAIENARLFAERERRIEQLAALHDVSLEVLAETDLSEGLLTILEQAAHLLNAEVGAISLFDAESQQLDMKVSWGYTKDYSQIRLALGEGVAGKVARTHRPLTVDDYASWDGRVPQLDMDGIKSALGVPLKRGHELLGVLILGRRAVDPFEEEEVKLATLLANQAAIALDNARSFATAQKRMAELIALREISLQLTQSLDLSTVLDTIARSAVELVKASDAHIFLYDRDTEEFTFGTGIWAPDQEGQIFTEVRKDGLTATVAKLGEPVVISEAGAHPLCRDQDWGVEAIAGFPLKQADWVLGVFNVAFLEPHTFDEDELRVLTLLADQAAVAIQNARLYQETDRRLKESTILQELSRLVSSSLEPERVFQTVVETVASGFGYSMVSIYTTEGDGLRLGAHVGYASAEVIDYIPLDKGVIGRVARSGEAELIYDVSVDPDYLEGAPEVVSEIAVPIMKDAEILGVLNVESTVPDSLTVGDLKLISSMGHQVSVAIQNAQLYQAAQRELEERKRAEEELQQSLDKLRTTLEGTVVALAALAEARDPYTAGHQERVARLASALAEEMGLPEEDVLGIRMAGLVHDIGKIYVPAEILSKPSRLTEIEMEMIKVHPLTAYEILKAVEFPWPVAEIVYQHHERMDGSGYPRGLVGRDTLLMARVLSVADVVEAMASNRPYRPAHGIEEALEEISQRRGDFYDGDVVDACLRLFREKGFRL